MSLLSLQRYGEWYYTRYFPSISVLREKILQRSHDGALTDEVMENLSSLFVERNIIESRINDYLGKGKTLYYIRQKLLQKRFDPSLIEEVLKVLGEIIENPETYRRILQKKCEKAAQRGLSRKKIAYELNGQYPQARSIIDELLSSYDDIGVLRHTILPRLISKYSRNIIIQKCIQAGFSPEDA